jgi:hypothetical protein
MKASFRTFVLLAAALVALVALPSVVMAAGGHSLSSTVAAVFGAPADLEQGPSPLPTPTPPGTVPPPTPRPIPPAPVPPRPRPVYPTPTPAVHPGAGSAMLGSYQIVKVIGDRLSSTIYAYTDNGWLYRSDRDGRSWYLVTTNPFVGDFVMSASDPNVLYSGSADCEASSATIAPMYKSENGGETWTELPGGLDLKPMLVDQGNPDNVFAVDCSTVYLSTDGGETWMPKPNAAADNIWATYAPVDMASGSLVGDPRPEEPQWDQVFAIGNDLQGVAVVAFTGDQGDSWADITDPDRSIENAKAIAASLTEGGKVWVVDSQGVWYTEDYGVNWTLLNKGLANLIRTRTSFNDVTYGNNGKLYLATDFGLYVLADEAAAWERPDRDDLSTDAMKSLLITESNPRRLWINALDEDDDPIVYTFVVK